MSGDNRPFCVLQSMYVHLPPCQLLDSMIDSNRILSGTLLQRKYDMCMI
jgi:hypothetical protein